MKGRGTNYPPVPATSLTPLPPRHGPACVGKSVFQIVKVSLTYFSRNEVSKELYDAPDPYPPLIIRNIGSNINKSRYFVTTIFNATTNQFF